mmetsp:Transcript_18024/g.45086  ORF Transcript_18024/g.45086 Transcript_18024/m.45086 type:complete len:362 (-) Transcript_18024:202-1287(-)|eukprot:CAMPEP_0178993780 /NCGR_PEP_ID=MMETSP0795-20121207/6896_1 /TAXON_ID=88552 /ORGANISM="Amoebophrya sp., Strain Ameob2" /LENGTH=361 /DNA_ID=CAMNT_0020685883 /DNA_START=73 /DNA_END=1158 /DNA_ORIENTATION=+
MLDYDDPDSLLHGSKRQRVDGAAQPKYVEKFFEKHSDHWFKLLSDEDSGKARNYLLEEVIPENAKFVSRMKYRSGSYGITCGFLETLLETLKPRYGGDVGNDFLQDFKDMEFVNKGKEGADAVVNKVVQLLRNWPTSENGNAAVEKGLKLTKKEIIDRSQKYCNSRMEPAEGSEKMFGAWAAMTNMCEKKSLFLRGKRSRHDEFHLTVPGKVFLMQFRAKNPNYLGTQQEPVFDDEDDDDGVLYDYANERDQIFLHKLREHVPAGGEAGMSSSSSSSAAAGMGKTLASTTEAELFDFLDVEQQIRVRILRKMIQLKGKPVVKEFVEKVCTDMKFSFLGHEFSVLEMNIALRLEARAAEVKV